MGYSDDELNIIYDKTDGHCYHCGKKIRWKHYGRRDYETGWEVDHLIPKALGGSDRRGNLVPACWRCNVEKGADRW